MTWLLSNDAERDLDELIEYGADRYGVEGVLSYYDNLVVALDRIASNPLMVRERRTSKRSVRLLPFNAHNVLYAIEAEDILVLRILHHSADWINKI